MNKAMRTLIIVAVVAVVLLTTATIWTLFSLNRENVVATVDFDDIVPYTDFAASGDSSRILRVAVGPILSPELTKQRYGKLFDFIGERVGCQTVLLQKRTHSKINELLRDNKVDMAWVCGDLYTAGSKQFGLELLVVPVVLGRKVCHSFLLANNADGIKSLEDLRDKKFTFTDPDSVTGCLAAYAILERDGQQAESFFGETFFTHSHDDSIKAVAEGLADGAVVDSIVWESMITADPRYTAKIGIIAKSGPYGICPVVVRPGLNPELKRRLEEVFLNLHKDPNAAALLGGHIDRFEKGNDAMYDSIRDIQSRFGGQR
ncbi:MAG: PhnD/SsuA/transferrin family substrate-binding protein [Planctomycetes bacterium]|nr:PhnD/SsuA/transferrin family substrate-binding protein [Planctomycetota bacterium]